MNIESLKLIVDINHDGHYSLWEVWEAAKSLYRMPGNLMVEGLGHVPYVSDILGIHASAGTGYDSFNGLLAITLSLLFWIAVLFAILTLSSPEDDSTDEIVSQDTSAAAISRATVAPATGPHVATRRTRGIRLSRRLGRRHRHHLVNTLLGHSR